jgi:hypothetical protein
LLLPLLPFLPALQLLLTNQLRLLGDSPAESLLGLLWAAACCADRAGPAPLSEASVLKVLCCLAAVV